MYVLLPEICWPFGQLIHWNRRVRLKNMPLIKDSLIISVLSSTDTYQLITKWWKWEVKLVYWDSFSFHGLCMNFFHQAPSSHDANLFQHKHRSCKGHKTQCQETEFWFQYYPNGQVTPLLWIVFLIFKIRRGHLGTISYWTRPMLHHT